MRRFSRVLSILACALAVGAVWMIAQSGESGARALYGTILRRIDSGHYDPEAALASLDLALAGARESADDALATDVQLLRGHLLMQLGAYDRAGADLEAVAHARPDDLPIQYDLIEIDARSGDFQKALQRVDALLARDPARVESWLTKGNLHRQAADHDLEEAVHALDTALVAEDLAEARQLLARSAALDSTDPERVALASRLRSFLTPADEGLQGTVLSLVDRAAAETSLARSAYVSSLENGFEVPALVGLCEICARAGRDGDAADLFASVLRLSRVRGDPTVVRLALATLSRLSRFGFAAEIASAWVHTMPAVDPPLLLQACEVLRRARKPVELEIAAQRVVLSGNPVEIDHGRCYLGLAWIEQLADLAAGKPRAERFLQARFQLGKFLGSKSSDPFPGARTTAYRALARGAELCQDPSERESLESYLQLAPDEDGAAWLRLAELELAARNTGYRLPEKHFAQGMRLLPERTAELLPRWREIGTLQLASLGIDLESVRGQLVTKRTWKPSSDASTFELYSLAELHLQADDTLRASTYAEELLKELPGFAPALDLAIEIAKRQQRPRDRLDAVLERAELAGRTPTITGALQGLRLEDLAPGEILRLMRADPDYSGRLVCAAGLVERGEPAAALASLATMDLAQLGDAGQVLLARVELAAGQAASAAQRLGAISGSLPAYADGTELWTRALLAIGDWPALAERMNELATTTPDAAERTRWLALADRVLARGGFEAARILLARLDSEKRLRGGDVLVRLAAATLASGDRVEAADLLDRAQAFETQGIAERLALLLALAEGRYAELPKLAPAPPAPNPRARPKVTPPSFDDALLAFLADRSTESAEFLDLVHRRAEGGDPAIAAFECCLAQRPGSTFTAPESFGASGASEVQAFVRGADGKADPRLAAGVLLALRHPVTLPVARARLEAWIADGSHGSLLPRWFLFDLDRRYTEAAPPTPLDEILVAHPDFAPAWDLFEKLELGALADENRIAALRQRRLHALGERSGTPCQLANDRARGHAAEGRLEDAEREARAAVQLDPESWEAHHTLGVVLDRLGRFRDALVAQRDACKKAARGGSDERSRARTVQALFDTLEHARTAGVRFLGPAQAALLLEDLAADWPNDPLIQLELARLDVTSDERNPALGIVRAYARLERFLSEHESTSLERQRPGAGVAWAAFYRDLDPQRGLEFVERQLELDPSVLALWTERARILARSGDPDAAAREFDRVYRMQPSSDVALEQMQLAAARDLEPEVVETWARRALERHPPGQSTARLDLARARAYLNRGPRAQGLALTLIDSLDPDRLESAEDRVEYAITASVAYLARGLLADRDPVVRITTRAETLTTDPFRLSILKALRGLARHTTPARRPEPPAKAASKG